MNSPRSLPRRVGAVVVGALLGLVGAVAIAVPANADHTEVSGSCAWDPDASEWLVTWTVAPGTAEEATGFRLAEVTAAPAEAPVEGLPDPDDFVPAGEQLVGEQRLPVDTASASLAVRVEWDDGHLDEAPQIGEVTIEADCPAPEPGIELGQWTFDCSSLTITVANPTDRDLPVTFAPSAGDPVSVELPSGESTTVQFPSGKGLSVDIQSAGESIVDPDQPIEITAAEWAEAECNDESSGEGGGLAATGTPVRLITAGAVALLVLGAALFVVARRRRIRFTA